MTKNDASERQMLHAAERKWKAKVRAFMDKGMTFDEAWVAAGGTIVPDASLIGVTPETLSQEAGKAA